MMAETQRADPFGDLDLSGFQPTAPKKERVTKEVIRKVSEENNFPSRSAAVVAKADPKPVAPAVPQRRRRTGRNVQFNIKATQKTINRFTTMADERGMVFGEFLELALNALEKQGKQTGI